MSKCISKLNQFIGRRVEITTRESRITFTYQYFNYDVDENDLVLMDETDDDCRVYIPVDDVTEIINLTDDLYTTVVDIKYDGKVILVCCAEKRPVSIKCDKCNHMFEEDEQVWSINQQGEYNSIYDGDWICKRLCDRCVSWLIEDD